jgi:hypothetical protein
MGFTRRSFSAGHFPDSCGCDFLRAVGDAFHLSQSVELYGNVDDSLTLII